MVSDDAQVTYTAVLTPGEDGQHLRLPTDDCHGRDGPCGEEARRCARRCRRDRRPPYDVVSDAVGGVRLEPAISQTFGEIHAEARWSGEVKRGVRGSNWTR